MKIDNQHNQPANKINRAQSGSPVSVEKKDRIPDQGSHLDRLNGKDAAVLSEKARLLAKARVTLEESSQDPDYGVRQEQVRHLQEQVASGNYEVPIEALAKKLLSRLHKEK